MTSHDNKLLNMTTKLRKTWVNKTVKECNLNNYSCPGACWEEGEWD